MKTVFSSAELPHIYFHAGAPEGRCSASMSFQGVDFYSYRTRMARIIERNGQRAVILNKRSYSVTTSKHQSWLARAVPSGMPEFHCDGEPPTDSDAGAVLFDYAVKQSADCEAKAAKARTNKDWHSRRAAQWLEKASQINAFFGLRRKVDARVVERLKAAALREEKKNAKRRAEEEKRLAVINAERDALRSQWYEQWKNGVSDIDTHNFYNLPVAFRIEENELVSTLGARVPLDSARVALRFILRKRGQDWRENGETCPVGHYRLNAINGAGIVAGCHRVTWQEIDRIAETILPLPDIQQAIADGVVDEILAEDRRATA